MKTIIANTARRLDRRRFLGRAAATTFGTVAAVAVGAPIPAAGAIAPCHGFDLCARSLCNGSKCDKSSVTSCKHINTCNGGSCWKSGSKKCCDCECRNCCPAVIYRCICYG